MKHFSFIRGGGWTVPIAVIAGVFGVVTVVQATTTISTNISTGGTLAVTGASTLTGAVTTAGDVTLCDAVADAVTANGYFTQLRIGTGSTFGHIGTVGADELGVEGDIEVDGTAYFDGTASTSALKVGDEPNQPTINGMVFGYCSFADVGSFTASTTVYVTCTVPSSLTGSLTTSDTVFVQATSSFDTGFLITGATTTGISTVGLRVLNTAINSNDTTLGGTSVSFWALR